MTRTSVSACLARSVCKNLFVHHMEDGEADLVFSSLPLDVSSLPLWEGELEAWSGKSNLFPRTVKLGESRFSLGTNWDEAVAADGVSSIFDLPPLSSMEDVVRDKVALAIDLPGDLVTILCEMGSYVAIVGEGAETLSSALNREACITLTGAYGREDMVDSLCGETGGADYVCQRFTGPVSVSPDVERMVSLRSALLFALVDEPSPSVPSFVRQIPYSSAKTMMKEICGILRNLS